MKKALLLTDGTIDMALSTNRWLNDQSEAIDLTVLQAYGVQPEADKPLKAGDWRLAKQAAADALGRWAAYLVGCRPGLLHTEQLLGEPERVLMIHLLLRQYDYLLIDAGQQNVLETFATCQAHIATTLCPLHVDTTYSDGVVRVSRMNRYLA